ncbi:MAG: DNA polymerase III subunit gamma/tau [Eubacteriales bacterium]|nr:DNA polymerase III subunit gamma/tau [Eubacteriales bacterium]
MSYTAMYRRFRPSRFEEVKGQDAIVTTLKNQIKADRIGHAYLFCGTRGTGKTTIAKLFAKSVNCEHPVDGSPCMECAACKAIASGASMNVIEIDAASNNGVDNIREIVDEVSYSPAEGKFKVYIIDEVHMLSTGAFNALLKTLEEPPSYVIFILATTEANKIPVTILSRCQRYDFKRLTVEQIEERMREALADAGEKLQIEDKALRFIAKSADGAMRDAWSLLDQCLAFHFGQELTYDKVLDVLGAVDTAVFSGLLRCVLQRDVAGCIGMLEEIVLQGRDLGQFVTDFTWYLRNLLLVKTSGQDSEEVIDISSENLARLKEEAQMADADAIMRYIRNFSELSGRIRYAGQKRVLIELALIRLCRPEMETNADSLLDRVRKLEQTIEKIESGAIAVAAAPAATAGTFGTGGAAAGESTKKAELPKAIPEDVTKIVASWPQIADNASQPMKSYLKNAKLSLAGDNRLLLVLEDGLASDYFIKDTGNKELLETMLSDFAGKNVEVEVRAVKSALEFESSYVDLTQIIHMDIEEE